MATKRVKTTSTREVFSAVSDHLAARIAQQLLLHGKNASYVELFDAMGTSLVEMDRDDVEMVIAKELYDWFTGVSNDSLSGRSCGGD